MSELSIAESIKQDYEEEIEKLKKESDLHCDFNNYLLGKIEKAGKEIKRLHSIIKEVREYIEAEKVIKEENTLEQITNYERNLLEILDKVGDEK